MTVGICPFNHKGISEGIVGGSIPGRGFVGADIACSPCVGVDLRRVLWIPPTVQKHVR